MMSMVTSLYRLVGLAGRCTDDRWGDALRDRGLAGRHALYLWEICRRPGLSQEALAHEMSVDKSSVTRNVAVLEAAGFVERRERPGDRRTVLLTPTDRAFEILPEIHGMIADLQAELTRGMSDEETELLTELLDRLCTNLESFPEEE